MAAFFDDTTFPLGLPIGRLVQGDCYELQTQKDSKTGQVKVYPTGHVNAGEAVKSLYLLVAYAKTDPAFTAFRAFLATEAKLAWPQYHDAAGVCTNPSFADKVIDGDGRDEKGKAWADRTGFAGHWVVRYGSTFMPKKFEWDPSLGAFKETEPNKIKQGDYIKVSGTTQSNNSRESPGMYVNPSLILFDHEGERIVTGPTAEQAFRTPGAPAPAAPPAPGAAAGPTMTAKAGAFTYAQMIAQGWTDAQLIEQGYMVAAPPAPTVQPAPPPPLAPVAPPAPPAAPPPPPDPPYDGHMAPPAGPTMTAKAAAHTYESMTAAGWTDAQLIDQGYMVAAG